MDGDGDLDEAGAAGGWDAGFVGVVGEGVEAGDEALGHDVFELGEEVIEGWFGGGEGVQELVEGDVGAGAEIAEGVLAFGGAEVEEEFLLGGVGGVGS